METRYFIVDEMKSIAIYARGSFDVSKPATNYVSWSYNFRESRPKTVWMNRSLENIGLPKYPRSMEEFLINAEIVNINYTAHQFGSKKALKSCCWISLTDCLSTNLYMKEFQLMQMVKPYMHHNCYKKPAESTFE